jgi:hypothetical protein
MLGVLGLLLLAGCATNSSPTADTSGPAYVDPDSGVGFPEKVGAMQRVSLNTDDTPPNFVKAHYTGTQPLRTPDQQIGLMQTNLAFFLNAELQVVPAEKESPDQFVSQMIRFYQTRPNFSQETYDGQQTFGNVTATCTQFSFDRPAWSDRCEFKMVVVPRGNYLVCFTFTVNPTQEKDWHDVIDTFIQTILARSNKDVLMTPNPTPAPIPGQSS